VCERLRVRISDRPNLTQHCKRFAIATTSTQVAVLPWIYNPEMSIINSLHTSAWYDKHNEKFSLYTMVIVLKLFLYCWVAFIFWIKSFLAYCWVLTLFNEYSGFESELWLYHVVNLSLSFYDTLLACTFSYKQYFFDQQWLFFICLFSIHCHQSIEIETKRQTNLYVRLRNKRNIFSLVETDTFWVSFQQRWAVILQH